MREVQRRSVSEQVRSEETSGTDGATHAYLEGYAAVFDSESEDLGGFREIVRKTAFDRALKDGHDVVARAHHKSEHLLGRTSNGTLVLSVDDHGLKYRVTLPNTTAGRDTHEYVKRGDISHSSFAFVIPKDGAKWNKRDEGGPLQELLDVDLIDVAPVVGPAYTATMVSARSVDEAKAAAEPPPGVPNAVNEARHKLAGR